MTTDVATYAVSGEALNNGSVTVSYGRLEKQSSTSFTYDASFTHEALETKYTSRFDDITYYVNGSGS